MALWWEAEAHEGLGGSPGRWLQSGHPLFQLISVEILFLSRRSPAGGLLGARFAAETGEVNMSLPLGSPCLEE